MDVKADPKIPEWIIEVATTGGNITQLDLRTDLSCGEWLLLSRGQRKYARRFKRNQKRLKLEALVGELKRLESSGVSDPNVVWLKSLAKSHIANLQEEQKSW